MESWQHPVRPWNHGRYGVCVGDIVTDTDGAFVRDTDGDAAIDRDILDERVKDRDKVDEIVTDGVTDGMKIVDAKK